MQRLNMKRNFSKRSMIKANVVSRWSKGKASSCAPRTSAKTVYSEELPVVQSVRPIPVVFYRSGC